MLHNGIHVVVNFYIALKIICMGCIWALTQENLYLGFANNKGADQPGHMCCLISAFVIYLLESIISSLSTSEISNFKLVSVAGQSGFNLTLSETPKTGLSRQGLFIYSP